MGQAVQVGRLQRRHGPRPSQRHHVLRVQRQGSLEEPLHVSVHARLHSVEKLSALIAMHDHTHGVYSNIVVNNASLMAYRAECRKKTPSVRFATRNFKRHELEAARRFAYTGL